MKCELVTRPVPVEGQTKSARQSSNDRQISWLQDVIRSRKCRKQGLDTIATREGCGMKE